MNSDETNPWTFSEVTRLLKSGREDTDTVRELLIFSCHSSELAKNFFKERFNNPELLETLLNLALDDYSGDAQMTASYWASQFPVSLLAPHREKLQAIATNEWDSVSGHARDALIKLNA